MWKTRILDVMQLKLHRFTIMKKWIVSRQIGLMYTMIKKDFWDINNVKPA